MKIQNVKFDEIREALEEAAERADDTGEYPEWLFIQDRNISPDMITIYGPAYRVTDKGVIFAEDTYCNRDGNGYVPDWSLTMIYEDTDDAGFDPAKYAYYEQDGPEVSIHNYLTWREDR